MVYSTSYEHEASSASKSETIGKKSIGSKYDHVSALGAEARERASPTIISDEREDKSGAQETSLRSTKIPPATVVTASSEDPTLLFSFIKSRKWVNVVKRCRSAEKSEAGTWIVEKNVDGSVRWKLLPLHQACESQAPSEVIKALLEAYPPAVIMKDSGGDLPLHLACRERASKTVITALLSADPDAAKVVDDEGRLPLHLACRQGAGVEIIDQMLICYHRAARTPDSYALLPLHWACAQNAAPSVVESLLRAHPDAVEYKDKWGRTPISLAIASTNPEKDAVMDALGKDPSHWTSVLLNEVGALKIQLNENEENLKTTQKKAYTLEEKLAEVKEASRSERVSFRELKNELESENNSLKDKIRGLTAKNDLCEEKIDKLSDDNSRLKTKIKTMSARLDSISEIFSNMEDQRLQILKVTGDMEESLQKASDIIDKDY